jgi:hypothetical protein
VATKLYALGIKHFLAGDIVWASDTIKARLVTSAYTPAMDTHEFLSSVSSGAVGTDQTLGTKTNTVTAGSPTKVVLNAANSTWTAVAGGSTIVGLVVYKDTGSSATSQLLAYLDFSATSNGGDITSDYSDTDGIVKITV